MAEQIEYSIEDLPAELYSEILLHLRGKKEMLASRQLSTKLCSYVDCWYAEELAEVVVRHFVEASSQHSVSDATSFDAWRCASLQPPYPIFGLREWEEYTRFLEVTQSGPYLLRAVFLSGQRRVQLSLSHITQYLLQSDIVNEIDVWFAPQLEFLRLVGITDDCLISLCQYLSSWDQPSRENSSASIQPQQEGELLEKQVSSPSNQLQQRGKLHELSLISDALTERGVGSLRKLHHYLTTLDVSWCSQLNDAAMAALFSDTCKKVKTKSNDQAAKKCSQLQTDHRHVLKLQRLNLEGCMEVGNEGIRTLFHSATAKTLSELSLGWCRNITNEIFSSIIPTSPYFKFLQDHLTELTLFECRMLSDPGLECLAQKCQLKNLRSLNISRCVEISDDGITALTSSMSEIRELILCGLPKITNVSLQQIGCHLFQLQKLNLSNCVNISSLSALVCHGVCLAELILDNCENIRDDAMAHLVVQSSTTKTTLLKLSCKNCQRLSDWCLQFLAELPVLKVLNVNQCENMTVDGINSQNWISESLVVE